MTANTGERDDRESARDYPEGPGDIPADTWALRLVASRHHAGRLSIAKAAARCGIDPDKWVRWEAGAQPREDKVEVTEAIAEGLGMNLTWLLFGGRLLPSRGRPTKRPGGLNRRSVQRHVRPTDTRPNGRAANAASASPVQAIRRPQLIDRTQRVAV